MYLLNISEIFYSIQGETSFTGLPCIFIRFTGCNLRCSYCDTQYAYEKGEELDLDIILKIIKNYSPVKLVTITGGEPLLQDNVYKLFDKLLQKKYTVLLETNGSVALHKVPKRVIKILDIKTPGSGMTERMIWNNLSLLNEQDEIKFVIKDRDDFAWALEIIEKFDLEKHKILFSPVYRKLEVKKLAEWIKVSKKPIRLQIQLQKYIWGKKKGV